MNTIYACFSTDIIHEGHINIIKEAKKYGEVIIGVLSDEAMVKFDRFPTIPLEERIRQIKQIREVDKVIIQNTVSYKENLIKYKPNYVIHGDNWKYNIQQTIRSEVIDLLNEWNGQLIEIPYTSNDEVKHIDKIMREKLSMPEFRRKRLNNYCI